MEAISKYVREKQHCVGARMGWYRSNYCVSGDCPLSLSVCRRGFQDLLKVRPSTLFMLCGCISSSMTSLIFDSVLQVKICILGIKLKPQGRLR